MPPRGERQGTRRTPAPPARSRGNISRRWFVNRGLVLGGGATALLLAGGALVWSQYDNQPRPPAATPARPKEKPEEPLSEFSEAEFNALKTVAVRQYNQLIGITTSTEEEMTANIFFVPPFSRLTRQQQDYYCKEMEECDVWAIRQPRKNGNKIYINGNFLRTAFRNYANSEENRKARREFVESTVIHEVTHRDVFYDDDHTSRLFQLGLAYILKDKSDDFSKYDIRPQFIEGAIIEFRAENSTKPALSLFSQLEEVEANVIQDYYMAATGRQEYFGKGVDDTDPTVTALFKNLVARLGMSTEELVKVLKKERGTKGGRERWIQRIGEKFAPSGTDPLSYGFDILVSVESKKVEDFNRLTQNPKN